MYSHTSGSVCIYYYREVRKIFWVCLYLYVYIYISFKKIDFRDRGSGRERNINVKNIVWLPPIYAPNPGYVSWPGIESITFWCTGCHSNQLDHLARAILDIFNGNDHIALILFSLYYTFHFLFRIELQKPTHIQRVFCITFSYLFYKLQLKSIL